MTRVIAFHGYTGGFDSGEANFIVVFATVSVNREQRSHSERFQEASEGCYNAVLALAPRASHMYCRTADYMYITAPFALPADPD
jgi:hypothetical protein